MTYTVTVTREDDTWLADVETVPGAHTYARSLAGLANATREVIILMNDLPDDAAFDLDFHFDTDDDVVIAAENLRRERQAHADTEAEIVAETRRLASILARTYSVRDAAAMLGITAGRVSQLT